MKILLSFQCLGSDARILNYLIYHALFKHAVWKSKLMEASLSSTLAVPVKGQTAGLTGRSHRQQCLESCKAVKTQCADTEERSRNTKRREKWVVYNNSDYYI